MKTLRECFNGISVPDRGEDRRQLDDAEAIVFDGRHVR
jgi:hypothetical protein